MLKISDQKFILFSFVFERNSWSEQEFFSIPSLFYETRRDSKFDHMYAIHPFLCYGEATKRHSKRCNHLKCPGSLTVIGARKCNHKTKFRFSHNQLRSLLHINALGKGTNPSLLPSARCSISKSMHSLFQEAMSIYR